MSSGDTYFSLTPAPTSGLCPVLDFLCKFRDWSLFSVFILLFKLSYIMVYYEARFTINDAYDSGDTVIFQLVIIFFREWYISLWGSETDFASLTVWRKQFEHFNIKFIQSLLLALFTCNMKVTITNSDRLIFTQIYLQFL